MLEQGKIDSKQAIALIVIAITATAILGSPAIVAAHAGRDAWISSLVASFLGLPIALLIVTLSSFYPGKTLMEYLIDIIGRWPGKILGLLYLYYLAHITAVMIAEYGGFITDAFMPETPAFVFFAVGLAIAAFTVKQGLEVMARVIFLFLPVIIFSLAFIALLALPEMDIKRVYPVFDKPLINIFKGSLTPLAWHGEIFAFAMLIPYLVKPRQAAKIAVYSIIFTGLIFLLIIITSLAVFGPIIKNMTYPVLNVSRVINIGRFLERPEPFIMAVWVMGGVMKVSVFYYIIVLGSAQLFNLSSFRPLVLPVGVILAALSVSFAQSTLETFEFIAHYWPFYGLLTFEFGIPLLLFIIALPRMGLRGRNK